MTNGKYHVLPHLQSVLLSTTEPVPVHLYGGNPFGQSLQTDSGTSEWQTQMREMNPTPSHQRGPGPKLVPASYTNEGYDTLPEESEVHSVQRSQEFTSWEPGRRGARVVLIHSPNANPGGIQTLPMKYICQVDSHQATREGWPNLHNTFKLFHCHVYK